VADYRSRIGEVAMVPADDLLANPLNWRIHGQFQQESLAAVLGEIGWIAPVIVNRTTGHIVDGHLRATLAARIGGEVPVAYVDLTEDEERVALATFDPLAGLAATDKEQLAGLLHDIDIAVPAINDLLAQVAEEAGLFTGDEAGGGDGGEGPEPEVAIGAELLERQDYLVIVFDSELDWQAATQLLGVNTVAEGSSRGTLGRRGLGRVIGAADFLAAVGAGEA
jgi:hypothetical protein